MKNHPNHITISNLKKSTFPDVLLFVDCETKQIKYDGNRIHHVLWFGCALAWRIEKPDRKEIIEEMSFTNAGEFWKWVNGQVTEKQSIYLFAHNVKFDLMVLDGFRLLPEYGFTLQSIYHKFTTTVIKFKDNNRLLHVADSMNYFQTSLDNLAPMVGEKKIQADFSRPSKKILQARCKSDVRIIYKAVRLIIEKLQGENLGGFRVTAPSISFSIFRTRFLKQDIITHHNDEAVSLEKNSYYGGFVQVFKLFEVGKPNLYKLDINAMYPSVMIDNPYPIMINDIMQNVSLAKFEKLLAKYLVTGKVRLSTDEPFYPYRDVTGVYYPIGEFTTTLSTPSLRYALERGHLKEVQTLATYLKGNVFHDYITYMYNQRMKAKAKKDLSEEMFYKIMMNSLYGKFGQTSTTNKIIGECDPEIFESYHGMNVRTGETFREILAGGKVIQIYEGGESRYTFYAVSSHVTDYARIKLFALMLKAGTSNVFYSDTDSLIVNEKGYKNLRMYLHPTDLGMLKVEDIGNIFLGFAKKDYLLGNKRKLKGFTREPIKDKPHVFKSIQSSSFYGAMSRGETSGSYWRMIEKIHDPYIKGMRMNNHGDLSPLELPFDEATISRKIYTIDVIKSLVKQYGDMMLLQSLSKWL